MRYVRSIVKEEKYVFKEPGTVVLDCTGELNTKSERERAREREIGLAGGSNRERKREINRNETKYSNDDISAENKF